MAVAENSLSSTSDTKPDTEIQSLAEQLPLLTDWLPETWMPFWHLVANFPLSGGLLVALMSLVLALLVRFVIFRFLMRLSRISSALIDDQIVDCLRSPVFITVLLFGFTLAVKTAGFTAGADVIINLLVSIIVISWIRSVLRASPMLFGALGAKRRFAVIEARTVPLFDLSAKLLAILVGVYVLLLVWGINPVGWLASAGIVGIAVGFAAKDTLANLFAGFFIVADAPYKIGDYINLDTGERGKVTAIGMRSTRLLTRDDVEVTIPNGVIANAKIVNESGGPHLKMRNRISVGVAYGSDLDRVCDILMEIATAHLEVCDNPTPRVRLRAFGTSSVDFELLVWIENPEFRGRMAHELYMKIYKRLAAEAIEIPYAKRDVYIKELPAALSTSRPQPE
ncbi:MAG: mechanosensitive ion channel family protein [Pseudomonadales bacterium]|nr:mechanosensitive ion channel family protein [Pseudomonadales bacterium]